MSEWKEDLLKNIVEIRVSNVDKKIYPHKTLVKLCNYMDVYSNDYINSLISFSTGSADSNEIQKFGLKINDVIITKDSETPGDIAIPSVVTEDLKNVVCGYHLAILRPVKGELDGKFLMFKFQDEISKRYFFSVANGSTRYGLTIGNIENARIKFPSISAQRQIAKILSTADSLIQKTQAAIAKYKAIKQGMLQDLFTRGIDVATGKLRPKYEDAPEFYKDSKLGMVPKEWEVERLELLTHQIVDGTHFTPKYTDTGIPFLRVTDVQVNKIDLLKVKFISLEEHQELIRRCNPSKGDILYSKNGTIGIPKIVDWDWEFSIFVSLCLIKPNCSKILSNYLAIFLTHDLVWTQIKIRAKQGTVTNLHLEEIREFLILLPTIKEQINILNYAQSIENKLQTEQTYLQKLQQLKSGLMSDLLSGRKSVKVQEETLFERAD